MRRLIKAIVPPVVILLLLGLLAGFAYFSQNPDSPALERAQKWPVVGEAARLFRQAYLPPEDGAQGGGSGKTEVEIVWIGPDGKRLTKRQLAGEEPAFDFGEGGRPTRRGSEPRREPESETGAVANLPGTADDQAEPPTERPAAKTRTPPLSPAEAVVEQERASYLVSGWSWFLPGNTIRAAAREDAETRVELESLAWLPILNRQGSWAEVVHDGRRGWIDTTWEPPYSRKGARRGLLRHRYEPVQSSAWGDLVRARQILGVKKATAKLGAYELLTDVDDPKLLGFLDTAAVAAEEGYFARYGRLPSGDPGRTAVLFATRDRYTEYSGSARFVSNSHIGHARTGLFALFAEGQSREELTRTLIHEIGHLLNDRALAWSLPPWLEEGLASDLGAVWIEDSRIVTGPAGSQSFVLQGPDARLLHLGEILEAGQLPPLAVLLNLDYETFHKEGAVESYAYSHSVALIRYLLDGEDGRYAEGFREFLKRIAGGRGADPRLLLKLLGVGLEELERGFRGWLGVEIEAARERWNQRARRAAAG